MNSAPYIHVPVVVGKLYALSILESLANMESDSVNSHGDQKLTESKAAWKSMKVLNLSGFPELGLV